MATSTKPSRIVDLQVQNDSCAFRLTAPELPQPDGDSPGYFSLPTANPNYGAMYALLLAAAVHGFNIIVQTYEDIETKHYPTVMKVFKV